MKLRNWQSECINSAIQKYTYNKHFLALATPGAGKTIMAAALAKHLYDQNEIDLVLCFSPSIIVACDFSSALRKAFDMYFDGNIGSLGNSFTYQSLSSLNNEVWRLFERFRVFVIFDEIHHCAGSNSENANSWGEPIISKIKENATYTIALTGTPWRSDALPIVLADYCDKSGKIQCDYIYGLNKAIKDNVCRTPRIIALDNNKISVIEDDETNCYTSFITLLSNSTVTYSTIVTNEIVIKQLLNKADKKLNQLRSVNNNAGGLIVASSITHAIQIKIILNNYIGADATVITSNEKEPSNLIKAFSNNSDKWVISVGMISEGTNIPRLQVCCYLSNIKTEMYFRQVLGRVLRITHSHNQEAILFMPAAPELIEYAYRLSEDIPNDLPCVIISEMTEEVIVDNDLFHESNDQNIGSESPIIVDIEIEPNFTSSDNNELLSTNNDSELQVCLSPRTNRTINILGDYRHDELEIDGFDNLIISDKSIAKLNHYNSEVF